MAMAMADADEPLESAREMVPLVRFFFALPEPLPLGDGLQIWDTIGNAADDEPRDDDPWVLLRFHQRETSSEWLTISDSIFAVVADQFDLTNLLPTAREDENSGRHLRRAITIVEAITPGESPDDPPDDWDGRASVLPPRADPIMRCIRAVELHVQVYRLASKSPYPHLAYERIGPVLIGFKADARREGPPDQNAVQPVSELTWSGPQLVLLEHMNSPDPVGPTVDDELSRHMEHWLTEVRFGSPFATWRERYVDGLGALRTSGDTVAAVLAGQTSSEVLLDGVLTLLMWEENVDPTIAAQRFQEGQVLARINREIAPRLKGNWQTSGNRPVALWYANSYRLRHRVVHGGYRPSPLEAEAALHAVGALETHLFDRLSHRRNSYMRATLMTVAEPGLRRRRLWSGKIRTFAEGAALTEASWRESYRDWRRTFADAWLHEI